MLKWRSGRRLTECAGGRARGHTIVPQHEQGFTVEESAAMTPKIFERTYVELKREVTSGRHKPGQRLQARGLADILKASTSPVTNAMRQLVGERVLEYTSEDGFIIPWVNEQRLRDLLSWSAWLCATGSEDFGFSTADCLADDTALPADVVMATEYLFLAIAAPTQNAELIRHIGNSNDRLRAIRALEHNLISDRTDELNDLSRLRQAGNRPALVDAVGRYYRRRLDLIPQLVGLSYQDRH